jgi:mRNA-degrading endonuclease RelE of RelBE toxin-antitoxin system
MFPAAEGTIDVDIRSERTCGMAVLIQPQVVKDVAKGVPREDWQHLRARLERVAGDPYGNHPDVERVKGMQNGYRVRYGVWRAVYRITPGGDVEVIKVGHRREVWR